MMENKIEPIGRPLYYNDTKISPWDVIDDWDLNFYEGDIVKRIKRLGNKPGETRIKDLIKIKEAVNHMILKESLETALNTK